MSFMPLFGKRPDPIRDALPRRSLKAALSAQRGRAGAALGTPTARYSGIQASYCTLMCCATGFATVFLLEYGVSIQQIGFVMALLNILTVLVQIVVGNLVSRPGGPSLRAAIGVMAAAAGAASLGLLLILGRSQALTVTLFIASGLLTLSMQPLITSVAMEHVNRGSTLDFGTARGLGSVAYAIMALILGRLTAQFGSGFLPAVHIGFALCTLVLVLRFKPPQHSDPDAPQPESAPRSQDSLGQFVGRYRRFFALLAGVICLTLCARVVSTYLIKIIQSLGGGSTQLGVVAAIGALVEFPIMAGFTRLRLRFKCTPLLRLSGVFYTLKAVGLTFAPSIPLLYLANCMQMLGYAIFVPAFTYYINQLMADEDRVRGQSFGVSAMTLGDVLGALLCGLLPASIPMRTVLLIGLCVSVVGSVMVATIPRALAEERA